MTPRLICLMHNAHQHFNKETQGSASDRGRLNAMIILYQYLDRYSNNTFHIARPCTFKWAALYTVETLLTNYIVLVTGVSNNHSTLAPYLKVLLAKGMCYSIQHSLFFQDF